MDKNVETLLKKHVAHVPTSLLTVGGSATANSSEFANSCEFGNPSGSWGESYGVADSTLAAWRPVALRRMLSMCCL